MVNVLKFCIPTFVTKWHAKSAYPDQAASKEAVLFAFPPYSLFTYFILFRGLQTKMGKKNETGHYVIDLINYKSLAY